MFSEKNSLDFKKIITKITFVIIITFITFVTKYKNMEKEIFKTYNLKMNQEVYIKLQTLVLKEKSKGEKTTINKVLNKLIMDK